MTDSSVLNGNSLIVSGPTGTRGMRSALLVHRSAHGVREDYSSDESRTATVR